MPRWESFNPIEPRGHVLREAGVHSHQPDVTDDVELPDARISIVAYGPEIAIPDRSLPMTPQSLSAMY